MCGLRRKILYPKFTELVSQFDIFCVSETKLDDYDIISIDGYDFFSQCRKQKSGSRMTLASHVSTR